MLIALVRLFTKSGPLSSLKDIAPAVVGIFYIPNLLMAQWYLRLEGYEWILFLYGCVYASDSMAYYVGKGIGERKLYSAVSPNKTIAGAVGSVAGGVIASLILGALLLDHKGMFQLFVMGGVIGTVTIAGDLVESMFKRDANIKDSGSIIPGHGGLLDKIDGALFAGPVLYWMTLLLMKKIVILGSTGSIGKNSLDIIAKFPDRFSVIGLTAGRNAALLMEQIHLFHPEIVAVSDEKTYWDLRESLGRHSAPEIRFGIDGISSTASMPEADIVISAIVGAAGLLPTLAAIRSGKTVALANKETLVMAGDLALSEVRVHGTTLLPVDSEHSAIFQCMQGYEKSSVKKIILTASGGPFIGKTREELETASPDSALKHPNWSMGRKISIDSATLMNKGLEVIEAFYLFGLPLDKIDVLIHPQSIIHSIVEFADGSYMAQLSQPDMRGPIAYALSYPERLGSVLQTPRVGETARSHLPKTGYCDVCLPFICLCSPAGRRHVAGSAECLQRDRCQGIPGRYYWL